MVKIMAGSVAGGVKPEAWFTIGEGYDTEKEEGWDIGGGWDTDAQFMNKNCPAKASNLINPSQRFQEVSGLTFNIPRNTHKFFHFDDISDKDNNFLL